MPNVCTCDFGYVGANCSIQCQCNGHSNCAGPDKLDQCLECHNETMGQQCDKCRPLFVGDPKNGGECVPCHVYCHGHTDLCVAREMEPMAKNMSRTELQIKLLEGSLDDAICLKCGNNTDGDRCDTCILGHFRGTAISTDICRICECHGHGDVCDPITGES
jgi:multipile epidermal growth factor-like domains protein 8